MRTAYKRSGIIATTKIHRVVNHLNESETGPIDQTIDGQRPDIDEIDREIVRDLRAVIIGRIGKHNSKSYT